MSMRYPPVLLAAAMLLGATGTFAQDAVPAAAAVGMDACATCHEEIARQFVRSSHGNLASFESRAPHQKCEACHGAGSTHVDSGAAADILGFRDAGAFEANQACLACHRQDHAIEWAGSIHAQSGVGCASCHRIHQSREVVPGLMKAAGLTTSHGTAPARRSSLSKPQPELCYDCHKEQRAQFMQTSHHPVREGLMTCTACHDAHGANLGNIKSAERPNDLCAKCHKRQAGPFVFEHAPVEESCMTCHKPHGAVANNLLKQGEPFLCLQCHEMHFHNARVTTGQPYYLPTGGSDNKAGRTSFMGAYNTRCTNCHNKVHGSDLPSQGVTGQGQALTR
jgi:predicted CXXCH cytochrome family protein